MGEIVDVVIPEDAELARSDCFQQPAKTVEEERPEGQSSLEEKADFKRPRQPDHNDGVLCLLRGEGELPIGVLQVKGASTKITSIGNRAVAVEDLDAQKC